MNLSTLEMNEDSSPSLANVLPSLPTYKVPLHVNVEPQSQSRDLEKLSSLETFPSPTKVVVRIRPLDSTEMVAGEKCYVRPVLTKANSSDPNNCDHEPSHSNKRILSPSTSRLNSSASRSKLLQFNKKTSSKPVEKRSPQATAFTSTTSIISCATGHEEQFDFDQVITPRTTQEQCYESLIRDDLCCNIKLGRDTTIVVMGLEKSGKTYTMNGDWDYKNSVGGENSPLDHNDLVENAGILPRAVHDLFETSKEMMNEYTSTIFMAYYRVPHEGGYTRDLLSRVDGKVKEVIRGVSYVHVDSAQEVKQLMDATSKRCASEQQKGRKFHFFTTFRVCRRAKTDSSWQISSKLTLVKLTTSSTLQEEQQESYNQQNLRDILQGLSIPPERQRPDSERRFSSLRRRLDDALLGFTSTLLIACLSPIASEMETTNDFLHTCVLAREATYFKEGLGISLRSISTTSLGDQSSFLSEAGQSIGTMSSHMQPTRHQVEDTLMNANNGSASHGAAVTKWKSQRSKLSRASTVAALSLMETLTSTKGDQTPSREVMQSARARGPHSREKVDSAMSPRTVKNIRYSRRNGPQLLRENENLKAEIGRLRKESKLKSERIKSLEDELEVANSNVLEERKISSKLEDIRDLLKRKVLLQEQRIRILEEKTIPAQDCKRSPDPKSNLFDLRSTCGPVDNETNLSPNDGNVANNLNLLASLDESIEGDAIYLSEEDGSVDSRPSLSYIQTISSLASGWSNPTDKDTSGLISLGDVTKCGCQRTLTSEYNGKIEFYLPRLRVSCLCGRQQLKISSISEDLVRIESIFRPWQAEFLTSIGIFEVEQFIDMHHKEEKKLVRKLCRWRKRKELEAMSKSCCAVALRVWARACSVVIRCRGGSLPLWNSGKEDEHDFLDISSMGSSMGY